MKKLIARLAKWGLILLALLLTALVVRGMYTFRDRNRGYVLDLHLPKPAGGLAAESVPAGQLRAGFARAKINPDLSNPAKPVWVAGFNQNRAATAIHDDLWAMACVVDDGTTRIGMVALDAIGFFHDDVIAVRRRCQPAWKLDYVVVCSTHNHSTPDLMGLWGPSILRTGVDPKYREQVIAAAARALEEATGALQPAELSLLELPMPTDGLVADTRKPEVFDPDVRVMLFRAPGGGPTLGSVVGWANHPETPWSKNTEITSDFCGYLRDALERGFSHEGREIARGIGGIHLYFNGAVGGLITTSPRVTVRDPWLGKDFQEPSHEKARAVGHQLASRILQAVGSGEIPATDRAAIRVRAKTIEVPLANFGYLAAGYLGLIDRGHVSWKRLRSEVALLEIGEASIACIPGEIYPEIVNGGIERAPGSDFDINPAEHPPLRQLMPGKTKFVFGLANDEIGYLIPKSEWDTKPPYLYGSPKALYGEVNSCGPEAALIVYRALAELCR